MARDSTRGDLSPGSEWDVFLGGGRGGFTELGFDDPERNAIVSLPPASGLQPLLRLRFPPAEREQSRMNLFLSSLL